MTVFPAIRFPILACSLHRPARMEGPKNAGQQGSFYRDGRGLDTLSVERDERILLDHPRRLVE
jgi:hypothetical protein